MKRLCIYMIFDKQNEVSGYISEVLKELKKYCSYIIAVCNFEKINNGKENVEPYVNELIFRNNIGFDAGAYKDVILNLFKNGTQGDYDELLLTNDTYFAPIYPFEEMFRRMDDTDCDYWGITKHSDVYLEGFGSFGEHIQSYFLNFKSNVFNSDAFKDYWENYNYMPDKISTIINFEIGINSFLSSKGFTGCAYQELLLKMPEENDNINPYSKYAYELVKAGIPIIKKINYRGNNRWLISSLKAVDYVCMNTDYDCRYIKEYVSRTIRNGLMGTYYDFDAMLEFVNKKNKIYIYGYGIWGHITADYFDYKGWKYESFVTSDGIEKKARRFDDIVLSDDDGIIIAQEYKHVCEQIINYMGERCSKEQIFTPCYV